LLRTRKLKMQP